MLFFFGNPEKADCVAGIPFFMSAIDSIDAKQEALSDCYMFRNLCVTAQMEK